MAENKNNKITTRPPVVVIMGHIDHGKSTLLDYIRKTNIVDGEAGGITQHISAYEVNIKDEKNKDKKITFLDTPGHEAFSAMRERGAKIADIAILIVSAEDGVKPQTIEAWKTIVESGLPCIVAVNKIDKPGINLEKIKSGLAENEIYVEDYGGKTPCASISAITGQGVDELLSLINIMAEMENYTADASLPASGYIVEAKCDSKRGIGATLIIKNGTIKKGMTLVVEDSVCKVIIMENFKGEVISEASFSSPIRLVGFDKMPKIGEEFSTFADKKDAEKYAESWLTRKNASKKNTDTNSVEQTKKIIPLVIKADVSGTLEAIEAEINKIQSDGAVFKVICKGEGPVSENDIKNIGGSEDALVIGFNVKSENNATMLAERRGIPVALFNIIYKMADWLKEEMEKRRPKIQKVEITGKAKIIKTFSRTKERQIIGGKVIEGHISLNAIVKIMRRDFEIGQGKIVNLEKNKAKASVVEEGSEFGMMIESKKEIAPGDILEGFSITLE